MVPSHGNNKASRTIPKDWIMSEAAERMTGMTAMALGEGIICFSQSCPVLMPACFKTARSVPSGMSPGWLGMVV